MADTINIAKSNVRNLEVSGDGFKDQFEGNLMNTTARETQDTVTGDNPQKEYTTGAIPKGPLGAFGRH